MGDGGVVDPVRGGGTFVGLVGMGAAGYRRRGRVTATASPPASSEDFSLFAELGLTHHRLSIEWARVEPDEGVYDQHAISHYRQVLSAARAAGITPWVCLHHFTLPRWFARAGGFLEERNRTGHWARHTEFIAETFGDLVGGWQPVNETNYYAAAAYRGRGWPPGHNDRGEWAVVSEAIQLASAESAVRLKETGVPVSSIFGLSCEVALDELPETRAAASEIRAVHWDAGLGLFRDGVLRIPGREPIERADLAGSFDLIGFSYYATTGVAAGRMVPYPAERPRVTARLRHLGRGSRSGADSAGRRAAPHPAAGGRVRDRDR